METLPPGEYAFWRNIAASKVVEVDFREQTIDIAGQEIMTADKVTLRMNAVVTYGDSETEDSEGTSLYFIALMLLVWSLGSFVYFALCELFLRGQTVGKRVSNIRVVKTGGFQLDAASIFVRNLFRVADHLPPLWIIPTMSNLGQRAGDMVAGTIVVSDAPVKLSSIRLTLAARSSADAQFCFDTAQLRQLSSSDFQSIERVLERWPNLTPAEQLALSSTYSFKIAKKLAIDPPTVDHQMRFLEDLFAAELRRQDRCLT